MSNEQIREGFPPRRSEDEEYLSVDSVSDSDKDREHLFVLSLVYYMLAVVFGLSGCGLAVLLATTLRDHYPFELFSYLIYGSMFITLTYFGALAGAMVVTGRSLAVQQQYIFCMGMSIVLFFNGPLGIPLGVWTLIVLLRRSVKDLFERSSVLLELNDGRIAPRLTDTNKRCLRILSINYIAAAAGMILIGLWLTVVVTVGFWITFTDDFGDPSYIGQPDRATMVLRFCIAATCAGFVWVLVFCLIRVARSLRKPMRYWFCVVIAAIICVMPPIGTALGVATLLVLMGDSVKNLFVYNPDTN